MPAESSYRRDAPEEGAVVDRRTLNRTLLARQGLLERADAELVELVEHLVGMQSQVPNDPYVGCWARVRGFDPEAFGRQLTERRLVRMTLFRGTLHLVTSDDARRIRPVLQPMLERAFGGSPFARELADVDLAPVLKRAVELLEASPLTLTQLRQALAQEWPEADANALAYAVRYLTPQVQVTPRGVWGKAMQPTATTLDRWLEGQPEPVGTTVEELVERYLRAFGPASTSDIGTWSWLADVRPVVARMGERLRTVRDESGRLLHDVADGTYVDGTAPAPVRFLPQYDNLFLSHADRARILDAVRWDSTFMHRGTLFADGFLAGAWKLTRTRREATLGVEIRTQVRQSLRRDVAEEAESLLDFLCLDVPSRRLTVETV